MHGVCGRSIEVHPQNVVLHQACCPGDGLCHEHEAAIHGFFQVHDHLVGPGYWVCLKALSLWVVVVVGYVLEGVAVSGVDAKGLPCLQRPSGWLGPEPLRSH